MPHSRTTRGPHRSRSAPLTQSKPTGDVDVMLLHQVLEGGLLDEELQEEDTEAIDTKDRGEGGLGNARLERIVEEGGRCDG
ncbi:hypothetical protein GW17_00025304 [Ensete ventricosum]|nr:hypothetical protein GW17_00025304 [Ensete ventricosum]RZS07025.1 hypothetical protein BHM03_00037786 [Ensete ventricosum]